MAAFSKVWQSKVLADINHNNLPPFSCLHTFTSHPSIHSKRNSPNPDAYNDNYRANTNTDLDL